VSVEVAWPQIERTYRRYPGALWLLVTGDGTTLESVAAACDCANDRIGELVGFMPPWGSPIVLTSGGWTVYLDRLSDFGISRVWVQVFANALESAGVTAQVSNAAFARFPAWAEAVELPLQLTAFVSFRRSPEAEALPLHRLTRTWGVDDPTSARITEVAGGWVPLSAAKMFLRQGEYQNSAQLGDDLARPLQRFLGSDSFCGVTSIRNAPKAVRSAQFAKAGMAVFSSLDETLGWGERLDQMLDLLRSLAVDIELAFIRYAYVDEISWAGIGVLRTPRPPNVEAQAFAGHPLLHRRLIPDAHGAQLLTSQHLDQLGEMKDWSIEEVGPERFLVTSGTDLDGWFSTPVVVPDCLANGRRDFEPILATEDDLSSG